MLAINYRCNFQPATQCLEMSSDEKDPAERVAEALLKVSEAVAPVWPLADYVAVNPYMGLSDKTFLEARSYLKRFSQCETLMPVDYYQKQYFDGKFDQSDIDLAIDELVADGVEGAESLSRKVLQDCMAEVLPSSSRDLLQKGSVDESRIQSVSSTFDQLFSTSWTAAIHEDIGKHCGSYYDQGQSLWASPWKHLDLYQSWRLAMRYDRRLEVLGLGEVREFVKNLPDSPEKVIEELLQKLGIPQSLWNDYLLCLSFELPGWSAWTQYQSRWSGKAKVDVADLTALIAIRLAYDAVLSNSLNFNMTWQVNQECQGVHATSEPAHAVLLRYALFRANEIGYRRRLLHKLSPALQREKKQEFEPASNSAHRKIAQMVFCIDVRSERIRRHLEAVEENLETLGFAGFFGLPFEFVQEGQRQTTNQLPVLISPKFQVAETLRSGSKTTEQSFANRRAFVRISRKALKRFKVSSVSAYAFVEATGALFGLELFGRLFGFNIGGVNPRCDGLSSADRNLLAPSLDSLAHQGISDDEQADMAEAILTNMGLTNEFAKFVVFCGHSSQTENNPLQAGLDCGACGGHSGEPNARLAAMLLNKKEVRAVLRSRGILVPEDTHFLAGLHNTTTDELTFLDLDLVPESHLDDLRTLQNLAEEAGERTRNERLPLLSSGKNNGPFQRSKDWSEVRPEWGLTGNASFVVGPRAVTSNANLSGRTFLHNYDYRKDVDGKVLEGIMTAPLVVTNWINMQYFASTVDQQYFGSGNKPIHNVVGRFGTYAGNGGDLRIGLPWESIHDGQQYQHDPVRLLSVIVAPRSMIGEILDRHENISLLAVNGWLSVVALDDGAFYRFTAQRNWELLISAEEDEVGPADLLQPRSLVESIGWDDVADDPLELAGAGSNP